MHVSIDKAPSEYSNQELQEAFWSVNRDRFPERYDSICAELASRDIEFEDLPQWHRNQRNLDAEVDAARSVQDTVSDALRIGYSAKVSTLEFLIQSVKIISRRIKKIVHR